MKKFVLICFTVAIILNGCSEQTEQDKTVNGANKGLSNELLEKIDDIEASISLIEEQLTQLQSDFDDEKENAHDQMLIEELSFRTSQTEHLLKHIPTLNILNGYIEQISKTESDVILYIQQVEMITDENDPNNYRLETGGYMELNLHDDIIIYVLDGVMSHIVTLDDLNEKNEEYKRLFEFYIVEDEAILISEQYTP